MNRTDFPIEYDEQTEQYFVIDTRPHAADRFAGQFDSLEEAEHLQATLRGQLDG